jgi:hypothetical protein
MSKLQRQIYNLISTGEVPAIYETDGIEIQNKPLLVKFFTPDAQWTWYAWEAEVFDTNDVKFFGLVDGHTLEMGYFLLSQLDDIRGHLGLPVEIDQFPNQIEYKQALNRLIK